jgi:hypothetical protein
MVLDSHSPPLTLGELEAALRATDPGALLVAPRLLRRVIKKHRNLFQLGLRVPHRKTYVIPRAALLTFAEPAELGLTSADDLPETILLLARPAAEKLAALPRDVALIRMWRRLFHAHVDRALGGKQLKEGEVRARLQRIGQVEFDEIRSVLRQDKYLLPPRDDRIVYTEFAAVYLELRHFVPGLLPHTFPGLRNCDAIDLLLAEDLDVKALLAATRLPGAPPQPIQDNDQVADEIEVKLDQIEAPRRADDRLHRRLWMQAERAAAVGNVVRAALLQTRAARAAKLQRVDEAEAAARDCLRQLVARLQAALGLTDHAAGQWRQALQPLLEPASQARWPLEARALYDLQKVCVDHERAIHAVDLLEWIRSWGRRPLKRPLPGQREWLIVKHLRSADRRLRGARVTPKERRVLAGLLEGAIHLSQEQLRDFFRPRVREALDEVGMLAANYPERIALLKLIEEVLDRIVASGYLTIGDLRDAVSRNNLKLEDLGGPVEFFRGDRLLQLDRRFTYHLDGIYRRGEIYLRWLQRLTALAFGNNVGRFLTLFVLLPFGLSWGAFETVQHVIHPAAHYFEWGEVHLDDPFAIALLGVFFLLLINVGSFRRLMLRAVMGLYRIIKGLVYDLPAFVLGHPTLRAIWEHPAVQFAFRFLIKPALPALPVAAAMLIARQNWYTTLAWSGAVFLIANWALNSRLGRNFEEIVLDWLLHNWERITADLLPGLFRFVWDLFKRGLETIDRLLYSVDEWLRFRTGEGWASFIAKLVLGFLWFWTTYLLRLLINVFIEPHFNPIKHFPAVTIGAKLLLPFWIPLTILFALPLEPLIGQIAARTIAQFPVWALPGVFGFLVWEMQANWRLYAANRAKTLRPVVIGSHGETLRRLLQPGFHSGTIPKLFARLRRAERRAARYAVWRSPRKYKEDLHHVEESLRHFVDRELVTLLNGSRRWRDPRLAVGDIHLGTNCIRIELAGDGQPEKMQLLLAEQSGWLVAGIEQPGWLLQLGAEERETLTAALTGLYLLAGIDLTREQIAAVLGHPAPLYPVTEPGLAGMRFSDVQLTWEKWVEIWDRDQVGKSCPLPVSVAVLPGGSH